MGENCRMEIHYMDPETYTAVANHELRQKILTTLFRSAKEGKKITKQDIADMLDQKYQQIVYQLTNHLQEFWEVVEEKKIRGARIEYIAPVNVHAVYVCLGKDRKIFLVDPIAELYGPLSKVGFRCDKCSVEEAEHCVASLVEKKILSKDLTQSQRETLSLNMRSGMRPLDLGLIESLKGLASGDCCALTIPCERCSYMKKINLISIE